ncbi:hypothetical protein ACFL3T_02755 [Patescibacteria group bacterium]
MTKFNFQKSKVVVEKGWKYILKEQDGSYYLIVPSTIGVGSDIIHRLTTKDREEYEKDGEEYIDRQIEKMRANPKDFEIRSWR